MGVPEEIRMILQRQRESGKSIEEIADLMDLPKIIHLYRYQEEPPSGWVFPAHLISRLYQATRDPGLLKYLADRCGYLIVEKPSSGIRSRDYMESVARSTKDFSAYLEKAVEAWEDRIIEKKELGAVEKRAKALFSSILSVLEYMKREVKNEQET
ncbi:MAG: hypothetical protein PHO00_06580 [bacterium]|nr:hypothetical protein [bacterium]